MKNDHETISPKNGHHHLPLPSQTNSTDHIYETPSNIDSNPPSSFETPTMSSFNEQGSKSGENGHVPSTPPHNGVDSGLSSEMTNATNSGTEMEKVSFDDESSVTSGITPSSIISTARLLEVNQQRESSPTSGVIIPEEKTCY